MGSINFRNMTLCLGKSTLAAGTTTTLSNTGSVVMALNGKVYSNSAMSNTATPTTDYGTGLAFKPILTSQGSVFVICFTSTGTLKVIQGEGW